MGSGLYPIKFFKTAPEEWGWSRTRDQGRLRIDLRLDLSDQKSQRVLKINENSESKTPSTQSTNPLFIDRF